ncbi:amidohydrolase family protein [Burkholderiaceae bacterium FT117]|uniref:amidohydrolase family protein n=1 Tax=Zeimonas sediminis TaxID=2944268 RepID=UPI002342E1F9|nr:amidohydrolase family protein [Zeimonas sediminis]MCM5571537.1 amidohydrolase family protein [Zeimonas sediminis]
MKGRRILLKCATLVTMDERLGVIDNADLLVHGDRIAAIAHRIDEPDAQVVDCAGRIVIPGLINAHLHTWQTGLRGAAANWTLPEYFRSMHAGLATFFGPEDINVATLAGALNQINCGTTTLVDWCHNNPTPEHTDAAIEGLAESGIRAVFMHGSPKPDPKPGQRPFWELPHPRAEIERLRAGRLSGDDALVTLGMAILGPHYSTWEVTRADFELAREYDLLKSMHCAGLAPRCPDGWDRLADAGLLDARTNVVHGNDLGDAQLRRMVEAGVSFSVTPEGEATQGHGFPIIGRLRELGARPSLGSDLESVFGGDMLGAARVALALQRARDNEAARARTGELPATSTVPVSEALAWITIEGARMLGQQHRLGSLTVGKQADLVVVDARSIGMQPVHDPVASVVLQAGPGDVEAVMIAGHWAKRDHRLAYPGVRARLAELAASGERILGRLSGAGARQAEAAH